MEDKVFNDEAKNTMNNEDVNNEKVFELLKISLDAQQKLTEDFGKGCTLWIILIGILINCVYNKDMPLLPQYIISTLGVILCIIAIFVNKKAESIRRNIAEDVQHIYEELKIKPLYDASNKLSYFTKLCTLADVTLAVAFLARFFI